MNTKLLAGLLALATAALRRRVAERPDDGRAHASLALSLFAQADDAGADEAVRAAEKAPRFAWAGAATAADVLVLREASRVVGRRFATLGDARDWLSAQETPPRLDASVLAAAARRCDEAVAAVETSPKNRLRLAEALDLGGHAAEAETEWRAALALDPKDFAANLGAATFVIRRAETEADLREARAFVAAAKAAAEAAKAKDEIPMCALWTAALLGLSGDVDGAEKAARQLVAGHPEYEPQIREILSAIGR